MANCHKLFIEFNKSIMLNKGKKEKLRKSRNLLRNDIRSYMEKNKPDEIMPKFSGQGSYMMHTIINPITDGDNTGEYDLDDGTYFIGNDDDKKTVATYHQWIYDAVKDRTKEQIDKNTCVRVIYADGYHIDLPIYFIIGKNTPELAHKGDGWIKSDPKEFHEWFNEKAKDNAQLRNLARYFKAWCDKKNHGNTSVKMPSGMIMTILVTEAFSSNDRDDIAFRDTMQSIIDRLNSSFSCYRPTTPSNEDLFASYSKTREENFLNSLNSFLTSANQSIEAPNQKNACLKWQKHFGNRFSCSNAKDEIEESNKYASPAIISSSAKSAME